MKALNSLEKSQKIISLLRLQKWFKDTDWSVVQPSEETLNSKHHSDREVAGALRRPIGGQSEAKNSREIYKMVRAAGLEPARS